MMTLCERNELDDMAVAIHSEQDFPRGYIGSEDPATFVLSWKDQVRFCIATAKIGRCTELSS